ncbi:MAG: outer membrane protein assembly factor BamA [Deltaproteobacteria bacterium]
MAGPRVALGPFDMYGQTDISRERKEVMEAFASALSREGVEIAGIEALKKLYVEEGVKNFTEEILLRIAGDEGADFAITGSIALLESTYSLNWRVIDVRAGRLIGSYSKVALSALELPGLVMEAAPGMNEKMLATLRAMPVERTGVLFEVAVEGTKRIDADAVLKNVASKAGEPFSPDIVRDDIRAIYSTGYFDDVTADLSETSSGKKLTFMVKEKPFVRDIVIKGNKKLSEEKLREAITVKKGTLINRTLAAEDAERLRAVYGQSGFYLAEVKHEIDSEGIDATITFDITENEKVKVKRITVIGNEKFSDKDIIDIMATQKAGIFSFITGSGSFDEYAFENDISLIMKHYYDKGYIDADILDYKALLGEDKKWFYITIAISEGERFKVGKFDITGDILGEKEDLIERLKLEPGDVFSRTKLSKSIEALAEVYGNEGYANADFNTSTAKDYEKLTVDLVINVVKHEQVYVDRIDIRGNVRTRDKVIRREMEVKEEDLFSSIALKKSKNNLKRLGYFEDVSVAKTEGPGGDKVNVDVLVKERPTGAVTFGVGYSSVDKIIGTASISQSNLMGTGLKLDLSGSVSATSNRYQLSFTEPWLFDRPISAGVDLFKTSREYPDFTESKDGFGLRLGLPLYKRNTYLHFNYRLENVNIDHVAAAASTVILEQEGRSTVSSLTTLVKHDTRDDLFFPTEGVLATLSTEVAGGPVGGTINYVKYEGSASKYFLLPWETVFSIRGVVGYTHSFGGQEVPIFERYFLGGMNSVRGFKTRSLGPVDSVTGETIGGRSKALINSEYIFPISEKDNFRGVLFFDMGNAYEGAIKPGDMRKGAGFGIRWYSPIGPLRLEWGYNLDRKKDERPSMWEFTIGGSF